MPLTAVLSEQPSRSQNHNQLVLQADCSNSRHRFGEIANESAQRVEAPLETLVRAGFVRKALPVGAPKAAKPLYEIADPYLAFWFSCLYAHRTEIEGGQGRAVLARILPVWQRHVGWVFEEAARAHAAALVRSGALPENLVVGRWWSSRGEQCEVDVLGLLGNHAALVGEARWQAEPLDVGDVAALRTKLAKVPSPAREPILGLWGRAGISKAAVKAGALGWSLSEMLRD